MADEVVTGHGSEFWLANAAGTLVQLAELTEVPLPAGAADLYETSHLKTQGFKTFKTARLADGEEADLVGNYIPGSPTDALIREAKESGEAREFRIVIDVDDDGTTRREFTGEVLVRNYVRSNPADDRRTFTATVKWSGPITEAEVA